MSKGINSCCLYVEKGRLFKQEERIHTVLSTHEKAPLKIQQILKHFIVTSGGFCEFWLFVRMKDRIFSLNLCIVQGSIVTLYCGLFFLYNLFNKVFSF